MKIQTPYKTRSIRFLEIHDLENWKIKIYSILATTTTADRRYVEYTKQQLQEWLGKSTMYGLDTYNIATLILHESKEGCFAIINWWTDENMLQHYVYLATDENPVEFKPFANNSIIACVWELAIIWFERNAWVEHILMNNESPDFISYFNAQLNTDM